MPPVERVLREIQGKDPDQTATVRLNELGSGEFPAVPPGTYYLMGAAALNGQPLL
jgi:hypothetical protein